MVYIFDDMNGFSNEIYEVWLKRIPSNKAESIHSYKNLSDKKQHLIAYLLLRYAVYKEIGILSMPNVIYSNVKPYLYDMPSLKFNLSHCICGVACIVGRNDVGVDIQEYIEYDDQYESILSCDEVEYLKSGKKMLKFTEIWTKKEAFGKYKGVGILYDLQSFNTLGFENIHTFGNIKLNFTTMIKEHYVISACSNAVEQFIFVDTSQLLI